MAARVHSPDGGLAPRRRFELLRTPPDDRAASGRLADVMVGKRGVAGYVIFGGSLDGETTVRGSLHRWNPGRTTKRNEGMRTRKIAIDVPESVLLAEKTDERAFARELRMLAAVKLHKLGRLSSGRAAEFAGMPRVEFLLTLDRYRVFPLEAELIDLERERA